MPRPPSLETIAIKPLSPNAVLFSYNQPNITNAFTPQQYRDLRDALLRARDDPSIRVVLLTGKGKHYCAGRFIPPPGMDYPTPAEEFRTASLLSDVLLGFPKVLIAAVQGAAVGWGCTQLANFDIVYAYDKAFFETPFTRLGLVPEGGSSYTFPKIMGKQRANALLLAGERLTAIEMYDAGLVTQLLPATTKEEFLQMACEKAKKIATYNGESLQMAKALVTKKVSLDEQKEASTRERHDLLKRFESEDVKAAMSSFSDRSSKAKI